MWLMVNRVTKLIKSCMHIHSWFTMVLKVFFKCVHINIYQNHCEYLYTCITLHTDARVREKLLFRFMPALHELRGKKQSKNPFCSTKKSLLCSLAAFIQNICSVEVIMNRLILPTIEQSAGTAVQRNYWAQARGNEHHHVRVAVAAQKPLNSRTVSEREGWTYSPWLWKQNSLHNKNLGAEVKTMQQQRRWRPVIQFGSQQFIWW